MYKRVRTSVTVIKPRVIWQKTGPGYVPAHCFLSLGKQAAKARPWATCAETSVLDSSKMESRTEIGFGPNSKAGSHASKWDENPSAGIEEVSVLPLFFRGCSSSARSGWSRSCTSSGGRGGSCSVWGWTITSGTGASVIGFFNFFSAPGPLVLPFPLPFVFSEELHRPFYPSAWMGWSAAPFCTLGLKELGRDDLRVVRPPPVKPRK